MHAGLGRAGATTARAGAASDADTVREARQVDCPCRPPPSRLRVSPETFGPRGVPAPAEGYRRAMATPDSHLEPHWRSAALLMVDLQRDFLDDGAAPV